MANVIKLKKDSYNSAKLSVVSGNLYGTEKIQDLVKLNFDEILVYLEENGFRNAVDKSYLQYNGFYLVERILNDHISDIYTKVFRGCANTNKILLDSYYLKYQIHNILVVLRCRSAEEKEIETYLIGDSKQKTKYIKAFQMPNLEDALTYLVKKLDIDVTESLKHFKIGIYDLENYLYKTYYTKLNELEFKYNGSDEKLFSNFVQKHIDLLNIRTFLKLQTEKIDFNFEDFYISGGTLEYKNFEKLSTGTLEKSIKYFSRHFGNVDDIDTDSFENLDKQILQHKQSSNLIFKSVKFGSPFFALKFLFKVEKEMEQLRTLLKAKYLKLSDEGIKELL